jgi:hypothetical protein
VGKSTWICLVGMSGRAEMWERADLFGWYERQGRNVGKIRSVFGGCERRGGDVGKSIFDLVSVRGRAKMWEI